MGDWAVTGVQTFALPIYHLRLIADKIPPPMALDVGLLLGANCNPAHVPLETVANSPEEPYAKRTVLGWSFTGSNSNPTCQTTYSHRVMTKEVQEADSVMFIAEPTPQQILDVLESDFQPTREDRGMSIDDRLFMSILEEQTYQDDTTKHVTMPLPFKQANRIWSSYQKGCRAPF